MRIPSTVDGVDVRRLLLTVEGPMAMIEPGMNAEEDDMPLYEGGFFEVARKGDTCKVIDPATGKVMDNIRVATDGTFWQLRRNCSLDYHESIIGSSILKDIRNDNPYNTLTADILYKLKGQQRLYNIAVLRVASDLRAAVVEVNGNLKYLIELKPGKSNGDYVPNNLDLPLEWPDLLGDVL